MKIIGLTKAELLNLQAKNITRLLTADELFYMAGVLGAYWSYNYSAAERGVAGKHAELKSLLHSDAFFVSRILLSFPNILEIIAHQLVMRYRRLGAIFPDYVAGVPDGATELAKKVAEIMGVPVLELKKDANGKIVCLGEVPTGKSLLVIEDFCTSGAGYVEAILSIALINPAIFFVHVELVILNRGDLEKIKVPGQGYFLIAAVVKKKITNWEPDNCLLCQKYGSVAIKPKKTDENWIAITSSQKEQ